MNLGIRLAEAGRIPDFFLRAAIRARHRAVLRREEPGTAEGRQESLRSFIRSLEDAPLAPAPRESNQQHYEVLPGLFELMLGPRLKYSACVWPSAELSRRPRATESEVEAARLARAEGETLALTARRAAVSDGMRILELGCGWGSFCLWAAENFPTAKIWAVSNSHDQGEFIRARARQRDLDNLQVLTADMNEFAPPAGAAPFDRIVSIEMFEHMRNWPELLRRIAGWLDDRGRFFMHVFSHREIAYLFREGADEWMAEHFFTGGMMPSDALLTHLQDDLVLEDHWRISGLHYARTLNSWLALLDARRGEALAVLREGYGSGQAELHLNRWRLFLLACAELFAFDSGNQWLVSHYRMAKRRQV